MAPGWRRRRLPPDRDPDGRGLPAVLGAGIRLRLCRPRGPLGLLPAPAQGLRLDALRRAGGGLDHHPGLAAPRHLGGPLPPRARSSAPGSASWYLAAWWVMPRMPGQADARAPRRDARARRGLGARRVDPHLAPRRLSLDAARGDASGSGSASCRSPPTRGPCGVSFVLVAVNIGIAAYAHRLFREGQTGLRRRSQEFLLALFLLLVCLSHPGPGDDEPTAFSRSPSRGSPSSSPTSRALVKWDPSKAPEIMQVLWTTTLAAGARSPTSSSGPSPRRRGPLNDGPLDAALCRAALARARRPPC